MNRKPNFNRGHGQIMGVILILGLAAICGILAPRIAMADQVGSVPELRVPSVIVCRSSTDVASAISASNTWDVAANGSGYTVAWEMDTALTNEIGVYVSVSTLAGGTHYLYLQGSNDGTNFANISEATSTDVSAATTDANMDRVAAVTVKAFTATGDAAFSFKDFGRFKYLRLHLDADASNAIKCDLVQVCKF